MLFPRDRLLERERAFLAPYATFSAESRGREHSEPESAYRTPFHKDRDRVLHTTAFRRLEYKTQVFVNFEGDYYRTRLTHTLEVAQVARSVAVALGLNETLAETIALAHDLGHPPFGHAGERTLNDLMRGHGGFEHNRQSLRIVTKLEERYEGFAGLNLTWETLEGIAKHESLEAQLGAALKPKFEPNWRPGLEAQLAHVADETAYNAHDLDDGLRSGLITARDLADLELWRRFSRELNLGAVHFGEKERRILVRQLLGWMITDLIHESHRRLETASIGSLADVRRHDGPLIGYSEAARASIDELRRFLFARLYRHHQVVRQSYRAELIMNGLFGAFTRRPELMPPSVRAREADIGLPRAVCDYLSGMTDRFAADEHRRLFGSGDWAGR